MPQDVHERIQKFYCETDTVLERVWGGNSQMIHFGYYPSGTAPGISHRESLVETVRQAAARLDPKPGQLILDAGCGSGGPAVWLARTYDVNVHGISNVPLHVESACRYARESGLLDSGKLTFCVGDYTATELPAGTFDGVLAIESVCYAPDTRDFLAEAFRLLKPGGRLVVVDGFRTSKHLTAQDEQLMKSWLSGWGASDLDTVEEFLERARRSGLDRVVFEDLQQYFRPSHYESYRLTRFLCPGGWLLNRLGLISDSLYGHLRAARDVWYAAERGLCVQGIFSAVKPES